MVVAEGLIGDAKVACRRFAQFDRGEAQPIHENGLGTEVAAACFTNGLTQLFCSDATIGHQRVKT